MVTTKAEIKHDMEDDEVLPEQQIINSVSYIMIKKIPLK